jgi:hypothetical protein
MTNWKEASSLVFRYFPRTCLEKLKKNHETAVRFQVLTAASMKMAVSWVVAPSSLLEVY